MVAFRGDYVHGGAFYDRNHTRIFMGLTLADDLDINTTHLEGNKNTTPPEIKRGGENGCEHAKNGAKKKKKRKA
jgi:hypothetical protein